MFSRCGSFKKYTVSQTVDIEGTLPILSLRRLYTAMYSTKLTKLVLYSKFDKSCGCIFHLAHFDTLQEHFTATMDDTETMISPRTERLQDKKKNAKLQEGHSGDRSNLPKLQIGLQVSLNVAVSAIVGNSMHFGHFFYRKLNSVES